jgi:hypothetical protein
MALVIPPRGNYSRPVTQGNKVSIPEAHNNTAKIKVVFLSNIYIVHAVMINHFTLYK